MNRAFFIFGAIVAVGALTWFFPLFHVVSRSALQAQRDQQVFRAADYVADFWATKLTPALADAADASAVLSKLRENPAEARTQFGRTAGLGRSTYYFVRGSGKIVAVDKKQIGVSLSGTTDEADIAIEAGLLFGNTVRDATGLISGDEFPNSQQFNEISTELNRRIESDMLPIARERAKVGDKIEFVGCAEVTNLPRDIEPLRLVPLKIKFK